MRRLRWTRVERDCASAAEVAVSYPLYLPGTLYVPGRADRARLMRPDVVREQLGALVYWLFSELLPTPLPMMPTPLCDGACPPSPYEECTDVLRKPSDCEPLCTLLV